MFKAYGHITLLFLRQDNIWKDWAILYPNIWDNCWWADQAFNISQVPQICLANGYKIKKMDIDDLDKTKSVWPQIYKSKFIKFL